MKKQKRTFGGIAPEYANARKAAIALTSIPYDGTSTWGKGADKGFEAFLEAAENMELYDIETNSEVFRKGIVIEKAVEENGTPALMFEATYARVQEQLKGNKFLTYFGGEHSISIGIIKAFYEHYERLSVLQLDAHTDLRPTYHDSPYNHACALHDASQNTNLVQVGIRSMDAEELPFFNEEQCYFAREIQQDQQWMNQAIQQLTNDVYITLDLDVLDPSIMPSTGTPEPGGMLWYEITAFLKKVFANRNVVGFDIVELSPNAANSAPDFLAAKLYYKMLSYKFFNSKT